MARPFCSLHHHEKSLDSTKKNDIDITFVLFKAKRGDPKLCGVANVQIHLVQISPHHRKRNNPYPSRVADTT